MSIRLIYHTKESENGGVSPFDEAVRSIVQNEAVSIACPYLGLTYLQNIKHSCHSLRILTDVKEWLFSSSRQDKPKILEFIRQNHSSIHYYLDLHSKVIVAGDKALVGSANFTQKGIKDRTEMSILFEAEAQVDELKRWFDTLWDQSSTVKLDELDKIDAEITSLPSFEEIEQQRSKIILSSSAPKVRSRLLTDFQREQQQSILDIPSNARETRSYPLEDLQDDREPFERLIERISRAANREWIDEYFDLLSELIQFARLEDTDPRLSLSIPEFKYERLPVTINSHYVLAASLKKKVKAVGYRYGTNIEDFKWSTKSPKYALTPREKAVWKQAVFDELDLGKSSSYRKHHQSVVYRAAVDLEYRSLVLDRAFPRY